MWWINPALQPLFDKRATGQAAKNRRSNVSTRNMRSVPLARCCILSLKYRINKDLYLYHRCLLLFSQGSLYLYLFTEVCSHSAERLRGALRIPSCSDHVREPGPSSALPPVRDVLCGREHEWCGLGPLLPSHLPMLATRCTCNSGQIPWRCVQINTIIIYGGMQPGPLSSCVVFTFSQGWMSMKDSTITTQVNTRWASKQARKAKYSPLGS